MSVELLNLKWVTKYNGTTYSDSFWRLGENSPLSKNFAKDSIDFKSFKASIMSTIIMSEWAGKICLKMNKIFKGFA